MIVFSLFSHEIITNTETTYKQSVLVSTSVNPSLFANFQLAKSITSELPGACLRGLETASDDDTEVAGHVPE